MVDKIHIFKQYTYNLTQRLTFNLLKFTVIIFPSYTVICKCILNFFNL